MGKFSYPHTCSEVDKHINSFQDTLHDNLRDLISDCCPMLEGKVKDDLVESYVSSIYSQVEEAFEGVRKCNSDMRSEIESIIDNFNDEIADRDSTISSLEYDVNNLESAKEELEEENSRLESKTEENE